MRSNQRELKEKMQADAAASAAEISARDAELLDLKDQASFSQPAMGVLGNLSTEPTAGNERVARC